MKKIYIKPELLVVDLRPEEQIGSCTFTGQYSGQNRPNSGSNKCTPVYTGLSGS